MTDGKIAERLEAGTEAERLVVREIAGQSAIEQQPAKSDDEGLEAQFGNQEAVPKADRDRKKQYCDQRGADAKMFYRQQPTKERAGQTDGRANRKVNSAGDDYECDANADDGEEGSPTDGVLNV